MITDGATVAASAPPRYSPLNASTFFKTCATVTSTNSSDTFSNTTSGSQVDIGELAFATMLNLVSNAFFSVDLVDPEFETVGEFKELVWRIMEDARKLNVADYFPALKMFDLHGVRRHVRVSNERLHEIFDDLIQKRLKQREDSNARNDDFLDVLLDHCQQEIRQDLFIAGSDTSGSTTEWAMAELLRSPEIMQKAKTELKQVIGNVGEIKESGIPRLPYIQAIDNSQRNPKALPSRASSAALHCSKRRRRERLHHPERRPSPDKRMVYCQKPIILGQSDVVLPERFLGGPSASAPAFKGRDFEYLPFGAGRRRNCPGLPLANRMISLMVATLVHYFEWDLPKGMTHETMDMYEKCGITLKKAVPLCLVPKSV